VCHRFFNEDGNVAYLHSVESRNQLVGSGFDAACSAVQNHHVFVNGGEVAAESHITLLDIQADAGRLERASSGVYLEWVVAKHGEVRRIRASPDAGGYWVHYAAFPLGGEAVHIGALRRFKWCAVPKRFDGPISKAITYKNQSFSLCLHIFFFSQI
jgi:hypothetical protein